jgi:vacuolar-type H+-ATPase subunit B/Vma2
MPRANSRRSQDFFENRDVFNSLELGWDLLRGLPTTMLGRIKQKTLDKCVPVCQQRARTRCHR